MLTEVKAYSSWRSAPELLLSDSIGIETDLIQIRNIEGLNPVKASVNTSPYGSVDGASYVGSSVEGRNIVLTLRPNPNWDNWTYEALRRVLYQYFQPKRQVKLVFYSDDIVSVEISGYTEDVQVNMFSKDPELIISIICPDPYFTAIDPKIVTGQTVQGRLGFETPVDYDGSVEAGIKLKVTAAVGQTVPTQIGIQIGEIEASYFNVSASVDSTMYFEMSSVPLRKFVQNVRIDNGVITNLLSKVIEEGSQWPLLQPGTNDVTVTTNVGTHDWELVYFERFGGL